MSTYHVPVENLPLLQKELDKLNKKAAKLGLDPVGYRELGRKMIERPKTDPYEPSVYREVAEVEVYGGTPIIDGWQFVAVIEHGLEGDGNIIRRVPGSPDSDLTRYRTVGPWCDHCQQNRRRNDTYIVANWITDNDVDYFQVGSSCLKDFIGHGDPQAVARFAENYIAFLDTLGGDWAEDENWGGSSGERYYHIDSILDITSKAINTYGWTSRKKAYEEGGTATADDVANVLRNGWAETPKPATDDAVAIIEWARSEEMEKEANASTSDYLHNLRTTLAKDYISARRLGIACSAVMAYRRDQEQKIKAERSESYHVGAVGQRHTFKLTMTSVREVSSYYGVSYLYSFLCGDSEVKWFSSKRLTKDSDKHAAGWDYIEPGDTIRVKATVKAHEEYRGVKQTVITRGKVV